MEVPAVSLAVDFCLLATVGLAVLLMNLLCRPFERGFYCNDESIHYPYNGNTVSTLAMTLVGLIGPVLVIVVSEWARCRVVPSEKVFVGRKGLPLPVYRTLRLCGCFLFGAGASQLLVDVAKFWVGRLRPHFIAVCRPDLTSVCAGDKGFNYVTEYACRGDDLGAIEEARLSFPSGHSALSFYAAVFTVMYLQCSWPSWKAGRLSCHFFQLAVMLLAWWTALTRISDYFHHWSDVLAGICIGSLVSILNVLFVSDLYFGWLSKCQQEQQLPLMTNLSPGSSYIVGLPERRVQNNM